MTATTTAPRARAPRHTPAKRRPNCAAIRPDLDPWFYRTVEDLERAIADGTFRREYGCRNAEEYKAAAKDDLRGIAGGGAKP